MEIGEYTGRLLEKSVDTLIWNPTRDIVLNSVNSPVWNLIGRSVRDSIINSVPELIMDSMKNLINKRIIWN